MRHHFDGKGDMKRRSKRFIVLISCCFVLVIVLWAASWAYMGLKVQN